MLIALCIFSQVLPCYQLLRPPSSIPLKARSRQNLLRDLHTQTNPCWTLEVLHCIVPRWDRRLFPYSSVGLAFFAKTTESLLCRFQDPHHQQFHLYCWLVLSGLDGVHWWASSVGSQIQRREGANHLHLFRLLPCVSKLFQQIDEKVTFCLVAPPPN